MKKHLFDYLILLTAGIIFIIFIKLLQGYKFYSFIFFSLFVVFYIVWGAIHHFRIKTIHLKNIVEYILIGFTIVFLLKIVINF